MSIESQDYWSIVNIRYTVTLKTVPMFGHPEEIDQTCNEIKLNN